MAPSYLSDSIQPHDPLRALKPADRLLLDVPRTRLKSRGDRAFDVAAPKRWNNLPLYVWQAQTLAVFKSSLKTYFYTLYESCFMYLVSVNVCCFFVCKIVLF